MVVGNRHEIQITGETIMSVGSVGGMGAMAAGAGMGAAGAVGIGGMGGLNGPLGDVNVSSLSGMSGTRMDQLLQLLDGFSSAEILIALMMSGSRKRHGCGDDSGLSFLLGLSLAAQLGQTIQQILPQPGGVSGASAATGQQLNATA